jgi:hypothetical protein
MMQSNAREEYHKLVPVVNGLETQNVLQIRSVAVRVTVLRAAQINMFTRIPAKTIARRIADRMDMHAMSSMQPIHAVHRAYVHLHATAITTRIAQVLGVK